MNRLTKRSQQLRTNMTKEEKHLWYDYLKKLPYTVNRQKVFGSYIVDFFIAEAKVVIELDGSQHYTESGEMRDRIRDDYFEKIGINILWYTNREIHENFDGVCQDILLHIERKKALNSPASD